MFSSTKAQFAIRPSFAHLGVGDLDILFEGYRSCGSGDILSRVIMKKFLLFFVVFLMSATATFAADDEHEQDRVKKQEPC